MIHEDHQEITKRSPEDYQTRRSPDQKISRISPEYYPNITIPEDH